ncbi:protein kinase [Candidatus Micrarchaeota archaeon]|nr:protein kinase [Candidatus Micrarchaeota archaeon]
MASKKLLLFGKMELKEQPNTDRILFRDNSIVELSRGVVVKRVNAAEVSGEIIPPLKRVLKHEFEIMTELDRLGATRIPKPIGFDEKRAELTMEYRPYESADKITLNPQLTLGQQISLFLEMLDAIHEGAHRYGVVHRDLKPANFILGKQMTLTDFGVARSRRKRDVATEIYQEIPKTTTEHCPPEEILQKRNSGRRYDIFSAGTILYRILKGEDVYRTETGQNSTNTNPVKFQTPFWPVIEKAMRFDHTQRYIDFEKMKADILKIAAREGIIIPPYCVEEAA